MSRFLSLMGSVLALTLLLMIPATAQTLISIDPPILSENFNELTPSLNATNVGAFHVIGGSVDVLGGAVFGSLCVPPTSGNCVDLNGSTNQLGSISSGNLTLTPGTYDLRFDLIGSQRGVTTTTLVTLGSFYNQTLMLNSSDVTSGIVNTTFTVGSTTVAPLIFKSSASSNADIGALLDNVQLASTPAPTPEPTTLSLFAIGLTGLFLNRRRAKAK